MTEILVAILCARTVLLRVYETPLVTALNDLYRNFHEISLEIHCGNVSNLVIDPLDSVKRPLIKDEKQKKVTCGQRWKSLHKVFFITCSTEYMYSRPLMFDHLKTHTKPL